MNKFYTLVDFMAISNEPLDLGTWYFDNETDHKHRIRTYFVWGEFSIPLLINTAPFWSFEVMYDEINVVRPSVSGNRKS
jgi:hypothetical protein